MFIQCGFFIAKNCNFKGHKPNFNLMFKILLISMMSMVLLACMDSAAAPEQLNSNSENSQDTLIPPAPKPDSLKIANKAAEALAFCKQKKYSTDFCILIDLGLHSGVNRFFIWDFKQQKVTLSCLTGHGCGDSPWSYDWSKENPKFSNEEGSHCSSLGKYKIGKRAYSDWGIKVKYLLHGLDSTNSNALSRLIVFHSWDAISEHECYPNGSPEGWGCPVISNANMRMVDELLKKSSAPVLMWVFA